MPNAPATHTAIATFHADISSGGEPIGGANDDASGAAISAKAVVVMGHVKRGIGGATNLRMTTNHNAWLADGLNRPTRVITPANTASAAAPSPFCNNHHV